MACGYAHTVTLSDDGIVHSFGRNTEGQLGLGHNNDVSLPTPIPNLPKIMEISCGSKFTVCIDNEGGLWSFGQRNRGTGNKKSKNFPQKIAHIPPVQAVSCGYSHTLIITNDSIFGHVDLMVRDNCVWETKNTNQNFQKHRSKIFQKYVLVVIIHYFKITKEKYLDVVKIV